MQIEDIFKMQVQAFGDRPALVGEKASFSFSELQVFSGRISDRLSELSLPRGTLVYLQAEGEHWCSFGVGYLGIVQAGMIAVLGTPEDIPGWGRFSLRVSCGEHEMSFCIFEVTKCGGTDSLPYGSFITDPLDVIFTSGSTGAQKPLLFDKSHWFDSKVMRLPKHPLNALHFGIPFRTSTGAHGIFIRHLLGGITSHHAHASTWESLVTASIDRNVFEISTSPYALADLEAKRGQSDMTNPRVRQVRVYAGPLNDRIMRSIAARFPRATVHSIYGLTEGGSTSLVSVGATNRFGLEKVAGDIVVVGDDMKTPVAVGEIGSIMIRTSGLNVPCINLREPLKSEAWQETGDLGRVNEDGTLKLLGRAKEFLIKDGKRVSVINLEAVVCKTLKLSEAVYFNFTRAGIEELGLILECGRGSPIPNLDDAAFEKLGTRNIFVLESLPRTEIGKIARHRCLEVMLGRWRHRFGHSLDEAELNMTPVDLRHDT